MRIIAQSVESGATGPWAQRRIIDHASAHGVKVDISSASKEVVGICDQAGFVASFPKRAGTPVARVELADNVAAQHLHHSAHRANFRRRDQQAHVVVHQHVRMQSDIGDGQRLAQQFQIVDAVKVVQKAGQAVVAALHDVLRYTGQVQSRLAGHIRMFASAAVPRSGWHTRRRVRFLRRFV